MLYKLGRYILERSKVTSGYWLTRFVFLRLLGFIYFFAFLSLALQVIPLLGSEGILPADLYLQRIEGNFGSKTDAFFALPTVFLLHISDNSLLVLSWMGLILSFIVLIGYANSILMFFLWALYMSFVHIGQLFYSYGWEIQLLETGFLAIFIVPLFDMRPFPRMAPPVPIIWLLRWLVFRLYVGTGLIKLRGSDCWKDFTCLFYHYETQPIPSPLSPFWHFMPQWFQKFGILWTHFTFLAAPWFIFFRGKLFGKDILKIRHIAGTIIIFIQILLIFNGNYAFLNFLAIIAAVGIFDDSFFRKILPKLIVAKAEEAERNAVFSKDSFIISWIVVVLVVMLSVPVVVNLLSSSQAMNTSFNQLHLVNTYGAFGSIGTVRNELIIEGTHDEALNENTAWKEYDFKHKPGPVDEKLTFIAPYQPRIDWQIWFAAMSSYEREPWLVHYVWKLLHNDKNALSLIENNPFPEKPPKYIRILIYRYEFENPYQSENVWKRELLGLWMPPVSKETQGLREFVEGNGWESYG